MGREIHSCRIIVRGGGDLATGTIYKLYKSGFRILVLESDAPSAIRRQVSVCEAVYAGETTIEDMTAVRITCLEQAEEVWKKKQVPVLVDPKAESIKQWKPDIVIDAIIAKKNLGTTKDMAPLTIGLGPGFEAGKDVTLVVETKRGHKLGRLIREGCAIANTGIPGMVGGYAKERVMHAPSEGYFYGRRKIGDVVEKDCVIAVVQNGETKTEIKTQIPGLIRGMIRDGYPVKKGTKVADVDPRVEESENCFTISDKARCIAGGVLEAVCGYLAEGGLE